MQHKSQFIPKSNNILKEKLNNSKRKLISSTIKVKQQNKILKPKLINLKQGYNKFLVNYNYTRKDIKKNNNVKWQDKKQNEIRLHKKGEK